MVTQSVFCNCCFSNKTVLLSEFCHFLLSLSQGFLNTKHTKEKKRKKTYFPPQTVCQHRGVSLQTQFYPHGNQYGVHQALQR